MTTARAPDDVVSMNGIDGLTTGDELAAGPLYDQWQIRSLAHAYQERPPLEYLIADLLPAPSLSVVYGGPGSLKSMILADMCVCVASGQRWLEPFPTHHLEPGITLPTMQAPVLWIDFDNGRRRTDVRFEALGRGRELAPDAPLHYVSMPDPWLDASNRQRVNELTQLCRAQGYRLIVIDNLGLITGEVEENSAEMARIMGGLRALSDDANAAVVLIHHQRKSAAVMDKAIRKGESLRGHSSIEASLDLALLVQRKEGEDSVAVIPTKVRDFGNTDIIGAHFTYEHKPDTKELATARFYSIAMRNPEENEIEVIEQTVKTILHENGAMGQGDLVNYVRDKLAAKPGGKAPGINRIRGLLHQMAKDAKIAETGRGTKVSYVNL